jgi:hypothetical protein
LGSLSRYAPSGEGPMENACVDIPVSLYHKRLQEAQERGYAALNTHTWLVPSEGKDEDAINRGHLVTWDATAKRFFCSCSSFRFRGGCTAIEFMRILQEGLFV